MVSFLIKALLKGIFAPCIKLIFLVFLLNPVHINAQDLAYRNFTVQDGLPSNEVHDIERDSRGYIWFATKEGLSRFDGNEFVNIGLEHGLKDQTVLELYKDRYERLWFVTISSFIGYLDGDSIHPYPYNDSLQKYLPTDEPYVLIDIFLDSLDHLHYSTTGNYLIIGPNGDTRVFEATEENPGNYFQQLEEDKLFIVRHKWAQDNPDRRKKLSAFVNFLDTSIILPITPTFGNNIFSLQLKENRWAIYTHKCLSILKENKLVYQDTSMLWCLEKDDAYLYIGIDNGLVRMELEGNEFKTDTFLREFLITGILKSEDNGMWVSSYRNGIFFISEMGLRTIRFDNDEMSVVCMDTIGEQLILGSNKGEVILLNNHFEKVHSVAYPEYDRAVLSMATAGSKIYFTTEGKYGIFILDTSTATLHKIVPPAKYSDFFVSKVLIASPEGGVYAAGKRFWSFHNDTIQLMSEKRTFLWVVEYFTWPKMDPFTLVI